MKMEIEKPHWSALLAAAAVSLLGFFLFFRRPPPRTLVDRRRGLVKWHTCAARCDELVRPLEIMCPEHWCQVPVPMRMHLRRLERPGPEQTPAWEAAARAAVRFVDALEDDSDRIRRDAARDDLSDLEDLGGERL
jgi:hypothetical protein